MREQVKARDHGICSLCSLNTVTLRVTFSMYAAKFGIRWSGELPMYLPPPVSDFLSFHHIPRFRASSRDWWDADHVHPVVAGGGSCGIDNIRTLCIPCHKQVTRAQRAARRRATA
jgi:5-methylcytosine-specific restriction protein A